MSREARYAAAGAAGITVVILVMWPFLDPAGRRGLVIAAAIALPIQVAAFWALLRYRERVNGFLAVWAGGTLLRMAVVALVAFLAIRSSADGAIPMLLGLAGFFFGLLLLEPLYFKVEFKVEPDETAWNETVQVNQSR